MAAFVKDLERNSSNFIGKLRSNFVGTSFVVYDNGESPKDFAKSKKGKGSGELRRELAAITYVREMDER